MTNAFQLVSSASDDYREKFSLTHNLFPVGFRLPVQEKKIQLLPRTIQTKMEGDATGDHGDGDESHVLTMAK